MILNTVNYNNDITKAFAMGIGSFNMDIFWLQDSIVHGLENNSSCVENLKIDYYLK